MDVLVHRTASARPQPASELRLRLETVQDATSARKPFYLFRARALARGRAHASGEPTQPVERSVARDGRIRPCVLSWKYTRLRPRADRLSGTAWRPGTAGRPGAATSASRAVCVHACWVCQCVVTPLLPRMKASPYLALSWPFTYSSVCSIAMFMKPSRHASTPVPQLASSAYA